MKDKIKFLDVLRWFYVKEKFKCLRCGVEYENQRAIRKDKEFICIDCIEKQGIFAITNKVWKEEKPYCVPKGLMSRNI